MPSTRQERDANVSSSIIIAQAYAQATQDTQHVKVTPVFVGSRAERCEMWAKGVRKAERRSATPRPQSAQSSVGSGGDVIWSLDMPES